MSIAGEDCGRVETMVIALFVRLIEKTWSQVAISSSFPTAQAWGFKGCQSFGRSLPGLFLKNNNKCFALKLSIGRIISFILFTENRKVGGGEGFFFKTDANKPN